MKIIDYLYSLKKCISNYYFDYFTVEGLYTSILPDRIYIKKMYKKKIGKRINLRNPKTFTEKLNWLKIYDRQPEYTVMVDKLLAVKYVKEKIKSVYNDCSDIGLNFVPLVGTWSNVEDIDFNALPNKFVLKCNHDNGVIVCNDKKKLDIANTKKILLFHLSRDYYKKCREWPYKNVNRKIICEQFMENTNGDELIDYKIFCFNGTPKMIMVNSNRFAEGNVKTDLYDMYWNHLDISDGHYPTAGDVFEKPEVFSQMIEIAQILSKNIPFLRVDLNVWDRKIYFGELTFFHSAAFDTFQPEKWDEILGGWLLLPDKRKKNR